MKINPLVFLLAMVLSLCDHFTFAFFVAGGSRANFSVVTQSALQLAASDGNSKEFASISSTSDGSKPRPTGSLGKPSKRKGKGKSKPNKALSKKERQRTANGALDSNSNNSTMDPSLQSLQVVKGNRGNKVVTIIRGMNATSNDDKKAILKKLKSKLGVGGTLVDGVLELQGGDKIDTVVDLLKGLGYTKTRKIG